MPQVSKLQELSAGLLAAFDARDRAREEALRLCRSTVRECSVAIRYVHKGKLGEAKRHILLASKYLCGARELLKDHQAILYAGFVDDAEQEYAEAFVVYALIVERNIPGPEDVGVQPVNYLCGLGDVCGELRRHVLDLIRQGRSEDCEIFLFAMEEIFQLLMLFDYPDAVVRGLRRKSDLARSVLEKTRGDLTSAKGKSELLQRMQCLEDKLKAD